MVLRRMKSLIYKDLIESHGTCKSFAPVFSASADNNPDIVFAKVDTEAARDLSSAFQIRSISTLIVFKEQIVVFLKACALPASNFDQLFVHAKKLDMDQVQAEVASQQASVDT